MAVGIAAVLINLNRRPALILLDSTKSSMQSKNKETYFPVLISQSFTLFVFFYYLLCLSFVYTISDILWAPMTHLFKLIFIELHVILISPIVDLIKVVLWFYFCTYFCVIGNKSAYTAFQILIYVSNHYDKK